MLLRTAGSGKCSASPMRFPWNATLAQRRQHVLTRGVLDVREQLGSLAREVAASAQQVPGGAHLARVHVGHREHPAAQKDGDLVGIDLVVLGLAPVDGLHVQGVAEDEGDPLLGAQIGEPVPREDALHGHHQVLAVRSDGGEEVRPAWLGHCDAMRIWPIASSTQMYIRLACRSIPQ